ncbi:unnamed protein product [Effrenium voratum]|nr:unnamed protein product [Effrenium voratum]
MAPWATLLEARGEPGEPLKLLDLCQQLEDTPADFPNERKRSEQIRRLGKALQGRSWAAHLAMQILASQFSVRLMPLWAPTEEALLQPVEGKKRPIEEAAAGKRKTKRRVGKAKAASSVPGDGDDAPAPELEERSSACWTPRRSSIWSPSSNPSTTVASQTWTAAGGQRRSGALACA